MNQTRSRGSGWWASELCNICSKLLLGAVLGLAGCASEKATEDVSSTVAQSHYFHGNELMKEQQYSEAAGEFEQAVKIAPNYVPYLNGLGLAYLQSGRSQDAVAVYKRSCHLTEATYGTKSLRLDGCYSLLGNALEDSGDVEGAVVQYQSAYDILMAAQPQFIDNRLMALSKWGRALAKLGREKEILPLFEALLADTPPNSKWRPYVEEDVRRLKLRFGTDASGAQS